MPICEFCYEEIRIVNIEYANKIFNQSSFTGGGIGGCIGGGVGINGDMFGAVKNNFLLILRCENSCPSGKLYFYFAIRKFGVEIELERIFSLRLLK